MKIRVDEKANYKAVFFNNKTVRMRLDNTKPITTPRYPEIEDVAINAKCLAGCDYCYTSAVKEGKNYTNILDKANGVWGSLRPNERPFQIAIGGEGEQTLHPLFNEFLKTVYDLGIVPNYTTNGMHLSTETLEATDKYSGGLALSYHPHIKKVFHKAMKTIIDYKEKTGASFKLNIHVILGDNDSFDDLKELYEIYKEAIDYFVILPYQAHGRGKALDTQKTWLDTFEWINTLENKQKFAFGALFYEWLLNNNVDIEMSIYEPEIYSGYRIMDDSYNKIRNSSYDTREKYEKNTNI